jgi:hypothetical protein
MLCGQRAARLMKAHGWGRIINVASASGFRASLQRTAYGTSKAAVIGLTRQMAVELAPHGITANAVAPGPVDTPLTREFHSETMRRNLIRAIPTGRYGKPEEMAATVSFWLPMTPLSSTARRSLSTAVSLRQAFWKPSAVSQRTSAANSETARPFEGMLMRLCYAEIRSARCLSPSDLKSCSLERTSKDAFMPDERAIISLALEPGCVRFDQMAPLGLINGVSSPTKTSGDAGPG